MSYRILALADIHWGSIDAKSLYQHLYSVFSFMKQMENRIDLIVICGDYFDYRLTLNSKAALFAVHWMHELVELAKEIGVQKICVIKGTEEHDNNQLDVFHDLEDSFFHIYRENTVEEILPGLKCIFCPDENINWKDYEEKYMEHLLSQPDIGFFHGSFDVVLPEIVVQLSEETSSRSVIYPYGTLSELIKGPMIAGHWHESYDDPPLHYVGSFDSWEHGEQNSKGFAYIVYDKEDQSYFYFRINNPLARTFKTIVCDTRLFHTTEDYNGLITDVKKMTEEDPNLQLRVLFHISDDRPENEQYLSALRHTFINDRRVKIVIKDLIKKERAKKEREEQKKESSEYQFIFEAQPIANKIQEYIFKTKQKSCPLDVIESHIRKYLEAKGYV